MLVLEDFSVGFGSSKLIKNLSISVDFPSIIAILGNNGVGKSTFLQALRGNIPHQGTIYVQGLKHHPNLFAFLGQSYQFNFPFSVLDFIQINASEEESTEMLNFLVQTFYLSDLLSKNINEISQGQLQKCLIAQTLMQKASVVLLDEPECHLDIKNRKMVSEGLKAYATAFKKCVVFVSHDLEMVKNTADFL